MELLTDVVLAALYNMHPTHSDYTRSSTIKSVSESYIQTKPQVYFSSPENKNDIHIYTS